MIRLIGAWRGRIRMHEKVLSVARIMALRVLSVGVNFCTGLLTAALLGPSGRGEQAALIVAPMFLGGIASLGLHGALIYNVKADPERERRLIGTGIVLTAASGLIAVGIGWIAAPFWLAHYDPSTVALGRILLLVTPAIVVSWTLSGIMECHGWFGLANSAFNIQTGLTLLLLGALAACHALTAKTAACCYVVPILVSFLYMLLIVLRRVRPILRFEWSLARRLAQYGARLAGVDLLGTLSGTIDQLVIVAFLLPGQVGTYVVALSCARLLTVVQVAIGSVLFPNIAARATGEVASSVARTFRAASVVIVACACVLATVGPDLLVLAYGRAFAPAVPLFRVLLVAMVAENCARILYQTYAGCGRPGIVTGFEAVGVATSLGLMLLLVPRDGAMGAAIAVLATAGLRLVLAVAGFPVLLRVAVPRLVLGGAEIRAMWRALSGMGTIADPRPEAP